MRCTLRSNRETYYLPEWCGYGEEGCGEAKQGGKRADVVQTPPCLMKNPTSDSTPKHAKGSCFAHFYETKQSCRVDLRVGVDLSLSFFFSSFFLTFSSPPPVRNCSITCSVCFNKRSKRVHNHRNDGRLHQWCICRSLDCAASFI